MRKKAIIKDLTWGLSLVSSSNMKDNEFSVLKNMFYNKDKRLQSRRGYTTFGNSIGTKGITSYFFFQNDITGARTAICTSWTQMYKYNESTSNWDSIKTGLTEFEDDWVTKTRWSFAVYKNIIYMCNGIDNYASYDGTTYTEYSSQPKVRYLKYFQDRILWGWQDTNPNVLYYTNANSTNANTINANDVVIWGDELWKINWINSLWQIILVLKDKKIYAVDLSWQKATPIDTQNGWHSHRAIHNVENGILCYSDAGVDKLKPRQWLAWASALASEPLSNDVRKLIDKIKPKHYNLNIGYYIPSLNSYYFTFTTSDDGIPDTTLVYNTLVSSWTEYNFPAIYDYWYYIDNDGNYKYLMAGANSGQMYEIETGFEDDGQSTLSEIQTKEYDWTGPTIWKTYESIDLIGYKNELSEINVEIKSDGEVVMIASITDVFINKDNSELVSGSIWANPIWAYNIWWGGQKQNDDDVKLYPYLIRLPNSTSWSDIQIRMYSEWAVWTLDKIIMNYQELSIDIFPSANIW